MSTEAVADSPPQAVTDSPSDAGSSQEHVATAATQAQPKQPAETEADRNWRQLREDRDYYRGEIARLQRELESRQPRQEQAAVEDAKPKTLADFEFNESAYQQYLRESVAKDATNVVRQELEAERKRQEQQARAMAFEERQKAFAKDNPGYFEAVTNPRFTQSDALLAEIMASDEGPMLALHLANNLDLANKLNRLDAVGVAREIARLEAKLISERAKAKEAKNQLPVTPEPAPRLEGGEGTGITAKPDSPDSDRLSDAEWARRRNAQEAARRRR